MQAQIMIMMFADRQTFHRLDNGHFAKHSINGHKETLYLNLLTSYFRFGWCIEEGNIYNKMGIIRTLKFIVPSFKT